MRTPRVSSTSPTRPPSRAVGLLVLSLTVPVGAAAVDTVLAQASGPDRQARAQNARPAPPPPAAYSYEPGGRRDPFVSLAGGASEQRGTAIRPPGLAGVAVGELALRGIVQNQGAFAAMIQAPDKKSYLIRSGDRLFDATVKAVVADAVVFVQEVTDPLSLVKQREIRKPLRPAEEGK
jgi:Tfp pilus assembly protein PilP